jgi:hypothetical protein
MCALSLPNVSSENKGQPSNCLQLDTLSIQTHINPKIRSGNSQYLQMRSLSFFIAHGPRFFNCRQVHAPNAAKLSITMLKDMHYLSLYFVTCLSYKNVETKVYLMTDTHTAGDELSHFTTFTAEFRHQI